MEIKFNREAIVVFDDRVAKVLGLKGNDRFIRFMGTQETATVPMNRLRYAGLCRTCHEYNKHSRNCPAIQDALRMLGNEALVIKSPC